MNKKSMYISIFFIAVIFIGGLCYVYLLWNQEYVDRSKEATQLTVDAKTLLEAYHQNETNANSSYKEKVIEVVGRIQELTFVNNRNTIILEGISTDSGILCDMQKDQAGIVKELQPGQEVRIKGVCKGFLKDVILLKCTMIKTQTNE